MNYYIEAQLQNMIAFAKTFEASCKMAAIKNDGKISKSEEREIKKISSATQKYIRELESIKP